MKAYEVNDPVAEVRLKATTVKETASAPYWWMYWLIIALGMVTVAVSKHDFDNKSRLRFSLEIAELVVLVGILIFHSVFGNRYRKAYALLDMSAYRQLLEKYQAVVVERLSRQQYIDEFRAADEWILGQIKKAAQELEKALVALTQLYVDGAATPKGTGDAEQNNDAAREEFKKIESNLQQKVTKAQSRLNMLVELARSQGGDFPAEWQAYTGKSVPPLGPPVPPVPTTAVSMDNLI